MNQAAGVVNANVNGRALTVDPGANGFANQGLLAASNGGVLLLTGNGGGAFNNSGGIIRADGGEVQLSSLVAISGGNLESLDGGLIRVLTSDAILSNLTQAGTVVLDNGADLHLAGTITHSGSITLDTTNVVTQLVLDSDVTLTGGGAVTFTIGGLNSDNNGRISGAFLLTNANNLIQAQLTLGLTPLNFSINRPAPSTPISADASSRSIRTALAFQPRPPAREQRRHPSPDRKWGRRLHQFRNDRGRRCDQSGAVGGRSSITGGTLSSLNGGSFLTLSSNAAFLTDVINAGNLALGNGADLHLNGTITNSGVIALNATNIATRLIWTATPP